jgi:enamine deaminase RidA (YjgF/YER057c/UK114 family)
MANVAGQVTQNALQSPDMQAQTQQALQNVDISKMMGAMQ